MKIFVINTQRTENTATNCTANSSATVGGLPTYRLCFTGTNHSITHFYFVTRSKIMTALKLVTQLAKLGAHTQKVQILTFVAALFSGV